MSDQKRVKDYPNPADGPHVEFYLERQQFMDPSKRYTVPVNVNGYEFHAEFGKKQRLPKAVVEVLKNAKSAVHPMTNARRVEMAIGGEGRPKEELYQSTQEIRYVPDFNVVEEKALD